MLRMFLYLVFMNISYLIHGEDRIPFTSTKLFRKNDSNFLDFEDSLYYFNTEFETNFYDSIKFCRLRNMDLVSIESQVENTKIGLYLVEKGLTSLKFWTSAVNMVEGGKWIWLSTGKDIKYFKWDRLEPTGNIPLVSSYENCIQARHEGSRGFTWNDLHCGVKNYAICEKSRVCTCSTVRSY